MEYTTKLSPRSTRLLLVGQLNKKPDIMPLPRESSFSTAATMCSTAIDTASGSSRTFDNTLNHTPSVTKTSYVVQEESGKDFFSSLKAVNRITSTSTDDEPHKVTSNKERASKEIEPIFFPEHKSCGDSARLAQREVVDSVDVQCNVTALSVTTDIEERSSIIDNSYVSDRKECDSTAKIVAPLISVPDTDDATWILEDITAADVRASWHLNSAAKTVHNKGTKWDKSSPNNTPLQKKNLSIKPVNLKEEAKNGNENTIPMLQISGGKPHMTQRTGVNLFSDDQNGSIRVRPQPAIRMRGSSISKKRVSFSQTSDVRYFMQAEPERTAIAATIDNHIIYESLDEDFSDYDMNGILCSSAEISDAMQNVLDDMNTIGRQAALDTLRSITSPRHCLSLERKEIGCYSNAKDGCYNGVRRKDQFVS